MLLYLQYYCLEITWCEDFSPECMFPKTIAPFRISCGTYTSNKARENPLQVFLLFFTLVLLETIVTQTNMMAAKKRGDFRSVHRGVTGIHRDEYCHGHVAPTPDTRLLGNR